MAPAAMISAATRLQVRTVAEVEQTLEAARPIGQRALLLHRDLRRVELTEQLLVLALDVPQAGVVVPDVAAPKRSPPRYSRCTSANTPNVTASRTGTPEREFTCAEISRMCPSTTPRNR